MATEDKRLDNLEEGLRKTQDSMLLMSKDIHSMNLSITSIASSMETLVKVQQDMKVMEERVEIRHREYKEKIKNLEEESKEGIRPRTLKNILIFSATIIIGFGSWITLMYMGIDRMIETHIAEHRADNRYLGDKLKYLDDAINGNKNQITYLKGRLKQ